MKHVPRLPSEPVGLAAYRQKNPADYAAPSEEAGAVWNRFRDDLEYKELLKALVDIQQGLCVYCEQRLVDPYGALHTMDRQIEHVDPKSGASGRVLDWQNLAAACCGGTYGFLQEPSRYYKDRKDKYPNARKSREINESCGQRKGDRALGRGCDPRTFTPMARLMDLGLDGTLSANPDACTSQGLVAADLQDTIDEVLNLNCERLRVARQEIADNIRAWFVPILEALLDGSHLTAAQQQQQQGLLTAGRLQPDEDGYLRAFWTTERCALGADAWVARNLALFT